MAFQDFLSLLNSILPFISGIVVGLVPVFINNSQKAKKQISESVATTEGIYAQQLPTLLAEIQELSSKNIEVTKELLSEERKYSELADDYDDLQDTLKETKETVAQLEQEIRELKKQLSP